MASHEVTKTNNGGDIRTLISSDAYKKQFAMALPKHLKAERFIRIALTALTRTPKLAECTQASLVSCLLDLSQLGLEPDGRKAHLIPYGDKCTLIVDYKGLVELARRSGEISDIHADVVCDGDFFEYSFGSGGTLTHRPAMKNRGAIIAAYSYVSLKDGTASYEVMSVDEIKAIQKRSKAGTMGPWISDFNEMAKKTVFRRHSKWLPISSERFQAAWEKDQDRPVEIKTIEIKEDIPMPKAKDEVSPGDAPCDENGKLITEKVKA
jgi:recombination protein RecT